MENPNTPNGDRNQNNQNNNAPRRQSFFLFLVAALLSLLCVSYFMKIVSGSNTDEITYNEFIQKLEAGEIESVIIGEDQLTITPKRTAVNNQQLTPGSFMMGNPVVTTYITGKAEDDTALTQRLLQYSDVKFQKEVPESSSMLLYILLYYVLPILLMWGLLSLLFRRISKSGGGFGGMGMGVGKSNAKVYVQKETGVTFKDVAGEDEAKESLVEIVGFLHNPERYNQIGARLPKGALLVGPPGTGKTLLAKAVAGEAGVPFFSLTGSDFIELYVGVGASRVRDLFKEAEKNAPCIVFIDEIDAIGRSRDSKYGGGNEEREQTLNQLLAEMDGFDGKKGIIILAATNRPEILDKALLRPGRFDRRIIVDKPDLKGRVEILKVHSKDVKMDETVDLDAIALATSGAVGSDLANMINEAAINAVKEGRNLVSQKDLYEAVEQVLVGKEKKDRIMSKEERRIVSYHEIGHALVSALQKDAEPVQKITIVPRTMGALGYVMHVPEEEKYLNTEAELRAMLVGLVAGRAAEEIVFDTVTTGAANDIEKATSIARSMVTQYGMSKKFGLIGLESVESRYLDGHTVMNCSDETATLIDEEVMKILKDSYKQAKKLLKENRDLLDKLAEYLIEKETITGKEFMKIYRKEKGIPEPEEDENQKDNWATVKKNPEESKATVMPPRPAVLEDNWEKDKAAREADQPWKTPKEAGTTQVGNIQVTPGTIKDYPEHPMKEEAEAQAKLDAEREAQFSSPKEPVVGIFSQSKLPDLTPAVKKPSVEAKKKMQETEAKKEVQETEAKKEVQETEAKEETQETEAKKEAQEPKVKEETQETEAKTEIPQTEGTAEEDSTKSGENGEE